MATESTTTYIFTIEDDKDNHRRARALKSGLARNSVTCAHINKLGNDLAELLLVARYRIIDVPTWLVVDENGDELQRQTGSVPSTREALAHLRALQ